jgi:hypothetical protein
MPRDRKLPEHFAEVRDILRIRIGVPAAIRDDLRHPYRGKRELIKSLGTGCLREAQHIERTTAVIPECVGVIAGFLYIINEAKPVPRTWDTGGYFAIAASQSTVRLPGQRIDVQGANGRLAVDRNGGDLLIEDLPLPTNHRAVSTNGRAVVPFADVIAEWVRGRDGKTLPKARQAMVSKFNRLAAHLGHRDAQRVTTDDLIGYRRVMLDLVQAGQMEPKTVEDHVSMLRQLFGVAYRGRLILTNPADDDGFKYKGRTRAENKRPTFTTEERIRILTMAREAEPVIRWSVWLAHFLGPRNAEILESDSREVRQTGRAGVRRLNRKRDPWGFPGHGLEKIDG